MVGQSTEVSIAASLWICGFCLIRSLGTELLGDLRMLITVLCGACLYMAIHAYFTRRHVKFMMYWLIAAICFAKPL